MRLLRSGDHFINLDAITHAEIVQDGDAMRVHDLGGNVWVLEQMDSIAMEAFLEDHSVDAFDHCVHGCGLLAKCPQCDSASQDDEETVNRALETDAQPAIHARNLRVKAAEVLVSGPIDEVCSWCEKPTDSMALFVGGRGYSRWFCGSECLIEWAKI